MTSTERAAARRDNKARRAQYGEPFQDMGETRRRLGYAPQPTAKLIPGYEAQRKLRWEPPKARR